MNETRIQVAPDSALTAASDSQLVSLTEIRAAAELLSGIAVRTPLLRADFVPDAADRVWLKPECLQRGGAFKFRGAYTYLASLSPEARSRGVIAPSSGNHAQAVALAARLFGVPATVVMPTTVTAAKREGAVRLGAAVELAGTTTQDRMERAMELVREKGLTLVPPYDDRTIIAGQGTTGLEIAEDLPGVATVLVPVGGGGLSAGVSTAIKAMCPDARVVGVEPASAPKLTRAREAGAPVYTPATSGLADGLLAVKIGAIPFLHHQAYIDQVVLVEDEALLPAMKLLLERSKLVVEPSGAITVAALMSGLVKVEGPVVAVLSGGNVDWAGLTRLFER